MATYVITHEVDDVEHWLNSPKREEVFGPMGITVTPTVRRKSRTCIGACPSAAEANY